MKISEEELRDILKKNPDLSVDRGMLAYMKYPLPVPLCKDDVLKTEVYKGKVYTTKYRAVRTEYNGITYDSKAEARYAQELDLQQKETKQSGSYGLVFWLRQVPFTLPAGVIYRVDFVEFYGVWLEMKFPAIDLILFTDVKGMDTPVSKLKRKQVENLYPVRIQVVK